MHRPANDIVSALLLVAATSVCAGGCAPEPYYDDELGIEGVPVPRGSLAGTFALKTRTLTLEQAPVFGEVEGGGTNLRLVTRAFDEESGTYQQESVMCGGENYEVAGLTQFIPDDTWPKVPKSVAEVVELEHDTGFYVGKGHLQLWGLHDLPDPFDTPLPTTKEEAASEPHASHIFDMEGDGHPGVTILMEGIVNGEIYGIQRKTVDLEGVTLSEDKAVGFAFLSKESLQLGADNDLLNVEKGSSRPFPDRRESWFEELRLDAGAGCDEVLAAEADGRFTRLGPFR